MQHRTAIIDHYYSKTVFPRDIGHVYCQKRGLKGLSYCCYTRATRFIPINKVPKWIKF